MHRFYTADKLKLGNTTLYDLFIINHIKALRLKKNGMLCLFNNNHLEWHAKIIHFTNKSVDIKVEKELVVNNDSPINIQIAQALLPSSKIELIIEKANELGVHTLYLFPSKFSNISIDSVVKKIQRFDNIIISSSEQCQRNSLLNIEIFKSWGDLIQKIKFLYNDVLKIYANPEAKNNICSIGVNNYKNFFIIIGSEGGFSKQEHYDLIENQCKEINLGKRILKAETASISIASFITLSF